MSKRLITYSVWGFYFGFLIGCGAALYSMSIFNNSNLAFFIFFIAPPIFSIAGFVTATYMNQSVQPDSEMTTWQAGRMIFTANWGMGLPVLYVILLIAVILHYFGLHIFGI